MSYYIRASIAKVGGDRRISPYGAAASSRPPIQPNRDSKHHCHRAQSCQRRWQMKQGGMFGDEVSDNAALIAEAMWEMRQTPAKLRELIGALFDGVEQTLGESAPGLFGDQNLTLPEIIEAARRFAKGESDAKETGGERGSGRRGGEPPAEEPPRPEDIPKLPPYRPGEMQAAGGREGTA